MQLLLVVMIVAVYSCICVKGAILSWFVGSFIVWFIKQRVWRLLNGVCSWCMCKQGYKSRTVGVSGIDRFRREKADGSRNYGWMLDTMFKICSNLSKKVFSTLFISHWNAWDKTIAQVDTKYCIQDYFDMCIKNSFRQKRCVTLEVKGIPIQIVTLSQFFGQSRVCLVYS